MKLATTRSPKFRRLMIAAGLTRVQAAGTLELLWLFTMEQAPAGDVGRWSDDDIEAELDWQGAPGALVGALVSAGWVDRCGTHRLVVHDWADHAPEYLQKRAERGNLKLAVVSPCPDSGGQRQPMADNGARQEKTAADGGIREEKSIQEKPSQEKPREGPASPAAPPAPARGSSKVARKTPVPERLTPEDRQQVVAWAAKQSPPITDAALHHAWRVYLAKARANGYRHVDHALGFMNALGMAGEAWALKDYEPPTSGGGSRSRPAEDVIAEAKRKQAEDDARARERAAEAERVGNVIDLALRQAGGSAA